MKYDNKSGILIKAKLPESQNYFNVLKLFKRYYRILLYKEEITLTFTNY
jgi:hypothetical protein